MIDFTTVTKDICIFYLNGVAGDEGLILNILKTSDNRYYFEYYVYNVGYYKDNKPISIVKETNLDNIKHIFDKEDFDWLHLYDIFDPKDGEVLYENTKTKTHEPTTYEVVKERFESTIDDYRFLSNHNHYFDSTKPEEILPFVLKQLESEN